MAEQYVDNTLAVKAISGEVCQTLGLSGAVLIPPETAQVPPHSYRVEEGSEGHNRRKHGERPTQCRTLPERG